MYQRYRLRRKRDRSVKKAREQRSTFKEGRRLNYPVVLSRKGRGVEIQTRQAPLLERRYKVPAFRFPLIGLRSQRQLTEIGGQTDPGRILREIKDSLQSIPGVRSVCQARSLRRRILFGSRVAGLNIRRSPGRGGTYRRTVDSNTSCEKVR